MPSSVTIALFFIVFLALCFDFINGFHDTANSIATSVSTRVLSPRQAILMAAALNFLGAIVSTNVAHTISSGIVEGTLPQFVIMAVIIAAIIWDLITWYLGIPTSSSHALIGALIGASITYFIAFNHVNWAGVLNKVVIPLVTSPLIGFALGYLFMKILNILLAKYSQRFVNKWFSKLQIVSAALMSFEHGRNDAQKSMGIITMALISSSLLPANSHVPFWVMIICAVAMALGTSIGGWKIIKTMGVNMIRLQPINGFAAETAAAAVIEIATLASAPVSTTHVISSAIMGVGASKRKSAVRWALAKNIVWAWVITIPAAAVLGGVITLIFRGVISFF
jgi:PiT family inorganic phosphate transporter